MLYGVDHIAQLVFVVSLGNARQCSKCVIETQHFSGTCLACHSEHQMTHQLWMLYIPVHLIIPVCLRVGGVLFDDHFDL